MAWTNLMVVPEGVARICCSSVRTIAGEAGEPLRLDEHDADAIWNSAHMRTVRRAMIAGERVADCESCSAAEAANGASMRTLQNQLHFGDDAAAMQRTMQEIVQADYRAASLPVTLHLTVSNLCNLTCRMCFAGYSSQIAQHPVLNRWAPGPPGHVDPPTPVRLVTRRIGPRPTLGVRTAGFEPVGPDGAYRCGDAASLDLPIAWFEKPMMLHVAIAGVVPARKLRLHANGRVLFDGAIDAGGMQLDLDISWLPDDPTLAVQLDGVGVPVRAIDLRLVVADSATRNAGKPGQRPSANHSAAVEALLANPELGHVNFTGGEPMLMPEVAEAIDYLIADGRAPTVSISLATNGTRIDVELIEKLKRFRTMTLFVSIDGVGRLFDYIRPPARWERVAANVRELTRLMAPDRIVLHPTVQAYNLLDLVEICRFADSLGLGIELLDILQWPRRLMIQVMPRRARERALERIRRYRERECRPANFRPVDDLMVNIERTLDEWHPELLPEFRRFTEELDQVHGQRFRDACPELEAFLAAAAEA
jgi:MoaA/NifB/PqqE/SkfB family radical SAM enzyme